jgi:hypothetical protein
MVVEVEGRVYVGARLKFCRISVVDIYLIHRQDNTAQPALRISLSQLLAFLKGHLLETSIPAIDKTRPSMQGELMCIPRY